MNTRYVKIIAFLTCFVLLLTACSRMQTLEQYLEKNPSALKNLRDRSDKIICSDYTVYNIGGGIDDSINATRYSRGLRQTTDRFVSYHYIVEDNDTGWKYIFESANDILAWAKNH